MIVQTLYDSAMLRGQRSVPVIGRLGGGAIATVSDSQPFRVTGANAVVYQLRQPTGKVAALRCWLAEDIPADVVARYRALGSADTLRRLRKPDRTPIIATIALHADGIQIESEDLRSTTLPVVVLDWLMGPTVLAAVDRACRSRDADQISALANAWYSAINAAQDVGFVHGDLTADNAIVRPKEGIAFVDYDTAFWMDAPSVPALDPALAYRHPRGLSTRPERADDFAALLMYASLRILAVWPELRAEHGQPATVRGAGLLFQPRDLAHPDGSPLFGKLRVLNDAQVLGLVGILREACLSNPDNMPTFHESLALAENVASVPIAAHRPRSNRMSSLLSTAVVPAVEESNVVPDLLPSAPISPSIEGLWPERQRNWRPERLVSLARAIKEADLPQAEAIWAQLRDEPGAGALLPGLEDLRLQNRSIESVSPLPGRDSRLARRRSDVERRFANALDHDDRSTLADMALSGDLDVIEDLSEASTRRVVGTLALAHLERALETGDDNLIIEAYDARVLGDQQLLTPEQRNRVDLAFDRRTWLDDVRTAIRERDLRAIDRLFAAMPDGAATRLRDRERIRIARLREQDTALSSLRAALESERDSDVVEALSTVERVGALIPADLSWTNVSDAIDRYSLLMSVRRAAEQQPRDYARLARLLPQLKDACGGVLPDSSGGIDFARLDIEVKKAAQLERIREALATDDNRKIVATALPDLYGVLGLLERGEQARVERAVAAANRALRRSGHRASKSDASSATVETR